MKVYIYPTDREWYRFLSNRPNTDEVNFWRPGGRQPFRQLQPGDLFLFRFGRPDDAIVGGGIYTHFSFAPLFQVWEAFGEKNGTINYDSFLRLIARYKEIGGAPEEAAGAIIGNIVLTAPFFLHREDWIPIPRDYKTTSPQGQGYDANTGTGRELLHTVENKLRASQPLRVAESMTEAVHFGESVVRRRLGQGGFSMVVSDAYEKRCAITGERTLPVLEAAHIVPVARGGMHRPDNGLLLRSDIHKLFDRGYVTVDTAGNFRVSTKLKDDWQNGQIYYDLDGRTIRMPGATPLQPARQFLEWHNDMLFRK